MSSIILSKTEFLSVLKLASEITKVKIDIPVTQCVTLETNFTRLFLRASNLESHLGACLNAVEPSPDGDAPSSRLVVNAQALKQMIKAMEGDKFTLRCVDDNLIVISDRHGHETTMQTGMKIKDFPVWKGLHGKPIASLKLSDLARLLGQVRISSAKEAARFAVDGALLRLEKGLITAIATDGSRMSKATVEADVKKKGEIILPSSAVNLLSGLNDKNDGNDSVEIRLEDGSACFSWKMNELLVKGLDVKFPDVEHVIPKGDSSQAKINKDDLTKALGRSCLGTGRCPNPTVLKFQEGEMSVISVINNAGSKTENRIPVQYAGAPVEVSLTTRYLKDFLAVLPSEEPEMQVKLGSPGGAIWMAGAHPERFQFVCMPVNA